jgi:hypothetical protein
MWKQLRSVYTNNEIVSGNTKQHQLEIILSLSCDIMQHHFDVMCKYPLSQIPGWRPSWLQAVAPDPVNPHPLQPLQGRSEIRFNKISYQSRLIVAVSQI